MAVLVLSGCGGIKPVPVRGKVTLDNQPVEGATVTFLGEAPGQRSAAGVTQADGSFQLTTHNPNDGAFPGNYKVTIQYSEGVEGGGGKNMKEAFDAFKKGQDQQKKRTPKYVIPPKYSDAGQTVLKQKVPPEGNVAYNLQSK
jgi:hypothetical protein